MSQIIKRNQEQTKAVMADPKPVTGGTLAALPPCASCAHPASDHAGPDMNCRICGDRYTKPEDDDLPSDVLWGE